MKVLKFGASWCPVCLTMEPIWQEIQKELSWLKVEFYDFDKNKDIIERYNIKGNHSHLR